MTDGVAASGSLAPVPTSGQGSSPAATTTAATITSATTSGSATYVTATAPRHSLFSEILDDINPLQYIPIIGGLYREFTGDEGNATLRFAASLGTSFALGGPVGVAITVGEKLAGIDPERAVLHAARQLLHLGETTHQPSSRAAAAPATPPRGKTDQGTQSLAFNVGSRIVTADDLNALELHRLATDGAAETPARPPTQPAVS